MTGTPKGRGLNSGRVISVKFIARLATFLWEKTKVKGREKSGKRELSGV